MTVKEKISKLETWYVKIQTPNPVTLGGILVTSRDFVFLRVTSEDGFQGVAYSLTRGAPLDSIIQDLISPRVIGLDSSDTSGIIGQLENHFPMLGLVGLLRRAQSLLDIALWDLNGKRLGTPVYKLLGKETRKPKIILVAPFRSKDLSIDEYASRVANLESPDVSMIKLYPEESIEDCAKLTKQVRRAIGEETEIILDFAWRWRNPLDVLDAIDQLSQTPLAWIEDPLPLSNYSGLAAVKEKSPMPIAAGDEASTPADIWKVIESKAVDVLRLDPTCAGGLTAVRDLAFAAEASGVPMSTHIYPEINRHVAIALPSLGLVETFESMNPFWGLEAYIETPKVSEFTLLPEAPGLGLEIRWDHLTAHSSRYLTSSTN